MKKVKIILLITEIIFLLLAMLVFILDLFFTNYLSYSSPCFLLLLMSLSINLIGSFIETYGE